MMRYQEGVEIQTPRSGVDKGMLVGTVTYSLLLGVGMVAAGRRAGQRWLAFWGLTLIGASAAFVISTGWG